MAAQKILPAHREHSSQEEPSAAALVRVRQLGQSSVGLVDLVPVGPCEDCQHLMRIHGSLRKR